MHDRSVVISIDVLVSVFGDDAMTISLATSSPRNRKAALGARLADALAQSSVIAVAPVLA
jgi:hypothetical protein